MFHNDYWLYKSAVSKEMCNKFILENDWSKKQQASLEENKILNFDKRITNVLWHDQSSELLEIMQAYIIDANISAKWNFDLSFLEKIQLGEYEVGGFYGWHKDLFAPDEKNEQRKLSISILLSDTNSFEGGQFEFKNIKPNFEQGDILVFPACLDHQVTPVTSGVRYSAVCWASGPAFK